MVIELEPLREVLARTVAEKGFELVHSYLITDTAVGYIMSGFDLSNMHNDAQQIVCA